MNKKDMLELRHRFSSNSSIDRLAGCYVDCNKNRVLDFNETFLNLQEEEFYKFLEIAKKTLSGAVGNNLLELEFPTEEEQDGGRQCFFAGLRSSGLKDEAMLDRLYSEIIEKYAYTGNYLILVFHDSYDVMSKTSDGIELDESEEVFEYVLVSVCPVELSKPALGYRPDENRIGARLRDWVVGNPDIGFLYPAFDNRSTDIHKVDYYTRDPKNTHAEFIEDVLGCTPRRTAYEQRRTLGAIVAKAYREDEDKAEEVLMDIEDSFKARTEAAEKAGIPLSAPIVLDEDILTEVLDENEIEEGPAEVIKSICMQEFADEMPEVGNLIDERALKANAPVKRERELVKEVISLKGRLGELGNSDEIILNVCPEKEDQIRAEMINDRRCIIIPVDDNEKVRVNGRTLKENFDE